MERVALARIVLSGDWRLEDEWQRATVETSEETEIG
jgi:hypothetical protein